MPFYNISIFFCIIKISVKYAGILVTDGNSSILDIENHSNVHTMGWEIT